jgi:hypothetical protein
MSTPISPLGDPVGAAAGAAITQLRTGLALKLNNLSQGIGVSGTWAIHISGNAASAARFTTARDFNGTPYDGSGPFFLGTLYHSSGRKTVESFAATDAVHGLEVTAAASGGDVRVGAAGTAGLSLESSQGRVVIRAGTDITLTGNVRFGPTNKQVSLLTGALTASRQWTLPDGNITFVTGTMVPSEGETTIVGSKTFSNPIRIQGNFDAFGSTANAQSAGVYAAALGNTSGSTLNPTNTAVLAAKVDANHNVAFSVDTQGYLWGYVGGMSEGPHTFHSKVKKADSLTTARTLTFTGDVSGTISYAGSENTTGTLSLSNTGTAGTYQQSGTFMTPMTFDNKGRLVATGTPVPISMTWSNVISKPTTLAGFGIQNAVKADGAVQHPGQWNFTATDDTQGLSQAAVVMDGGLSIKKGLRVGGSVTFLGKTTFIGPVIETSSRQSLVVNDPVVTLGGTTVLTGDDGFDRGLEFRWHDGTSSLKGFMGWNRTTDRFRLVPRATLANGSYNGTVGVLEANLVGDVTGNADTASALATLSDYRLKTIERPYRGSSTFFDNLKLYEGTWTETGHRFVGPLAHELQELMPAVVSYSKDYTASDGLPMYQRVNYAHPELVCVQLAETQRLRDRVSILEEENRALIETLLDFTQQFKALKNQVTQLQAGWTPPAA